VTKGGLFSSKSKCDVLVRGDRQLQRGDAVLVHVRNSIVGWHVRFGVGEEFAQRYEDLAANPC
jgi:hypothetical protein